MLHGAIHTISRPVYVSSGVGWGTLAMLNGGLAESKGRSKVLWSLLSLGIGPLATAYLVYFASPIHTMHVHSYNTK
jgi:hypothetical protein